MYDDWRRGDLKSDYIVKGNIKYTGFWTGLSTEFQEKLDARFNAHLKMVTRPSMHFTCTCLNYMSILTIQMSEKIN